MVDHLNAGSFFDQIEADRINRNITQPLLDEALQDRQTIKALVKALKDLDACYCEASDEMSCVQHDHHRKVLTAAREAVAKAEGR